MPEVGKRVGGFRLVRELGSGGFGSVHLGEDASGRQAAVKLLHPHLAKDPQVRRYFTQELTNARQVQGFCLAEILDADPEAEEPWIATEYVDGPTLGEAVRQNGPRTGGDLRRLMVQTITALSAIHAAGVVHRDLKPANILLGPDGPRVIDFGIARALDADTHSATRIGTVGYMAPEQLEGTTLGAAADLFAWGSVIVFAATGADAFPGPTQASRMHRVLTQPPETGDLSGHLRSIVLACMEKDAKDRPTARQVLDMLLSGRTTPEPEPAASHGLQQDAQPQPSASSEEASRFSRSPAATGAADPRHTGRAAQWAGFAISGVAAAVLLALVALPVAEDGDSAHTPWIAMGETMRQGMFVSMAAAATLGALGAHLRNGGLAASAAAPAVLGAGALAYIALDVSDTYPHFGWYLALFMLVVIIGLSIAASGPGPDQSAASGARSPAAVAAVPWTGFAICGAAVVLLLILAGSPWDLDANISMVWVQDWPAGNYFPPPGMVMLWCAVAAGTLGAFGGARRQGRLAATASAPAALGLFLLSVMAADTDIFEALSSGGDGAFLMLVVIIALSITALALTHRR